MSIVDQKNKIFGEIASARVLIDDFPTFSKNPSFPSISNKSKRLYQP